VLVTSDEGIPGNRRENPIFAVIDFVASNFEHGFRVQRCY